MLGTRYSTKRGILECSIAVVVVTMYYKIISIPYRKTWANSLVCALQAACWKEIALYADEKNDLRFNFEKDHKTTFHMKFQWRKYLIVYIRKRTIFWNSEVSKQNHHVFKKCLVFQNLAIWHDAWCLL